MTNFEKMIEKDLEGQVGVQFKRQVKYLVRSQFWVSSE